MQIHLSHHYANDRPHFEGHVEEHRRVGLWTWWHENGAMKSQGRFEDGLETGVWTTWHSNGQKESEGEYLYGRKDGIWRRWDDAGVLVSEERYDLGIVVSDEDERDGTGFWSRLLGAT